MFQYPQPDRIVWRMLKLSWSPATIASFSIRNRIELFEGDYMRKDPDTAYLFQYPQPDRIVWRTSSARSSPSSSTVSVSATGSNCLKASRCNLLLVRKVSFQYPQPDRIVWRSTSASVTVNIDEFQYPQPDRIVWRILLRRLDFHGVCVSVSATGSNCLKALCNTGDFIVKVRVSVSATGSNCLKDNALVMHYLIIVCFSIRNRIELFEGNGVLRVIQGFSCFSIRNRIELFEGSWQTILLTAPAGSFSIRNRIELFEGAIPKYWSTCGT